MWCSCLVLNACGARCARQAVSILGAQALKHTFFSALMSAVALPAYIIKACDVLDTPWAVAYERAPLRDDATHKCHVL